MILSFILFFVLFEMANLFRYFSPRHLLLSLFLRRHSIKAVLYFVYLVVIVHRLELAAFFDVNARAD